MPKEAKFHLTKEGLIKIEKEYKKVKKLRRLKLEKEAPLVLHSEELSTESLCWREDMGILDSRIAELEYILKNFQLIKTPPKKERGKINLGAQVALEVDGQKDQFIIVGTLEANPSLGKISNESPVGKALMGHKAGDEIIISSPIKTLYKIKRVNYSKDS